MLSRRLWALTLLAAVFVMHGVPFLGGAGDHGGALIHQEVQGRSGTADLMSGLSMSPGSVLAASPVMAAAAEQLTVLADDGGAGAPDDGMGSHLWAACLAVLLIGVVLLGAGVLARTRAASPFDGVRAAGLRLGQRALVERPPDLSALCLLRI